MEHQLEFRESEGPWSPIAAVAEINARTGAGLELIGLDEQTGGTSGAAYVRWPDGREGALTRSAISLDWMQTTAEILSRLRAEGLPVPRHDLVIALSDGRLAVVQERLPGRPATWVDAARIEAMVRANDQFAHALRRDMPMLPPVVAANGDGIDPRQEVLATYSQRSRRLLRQIQAIEKTIPDGLPNAGLVHPDFGLGNLLFDASGTISGIVDWNGGAWRGDHRFALLKLSINIAAEGDGYGVTPEARAHLDDLLRQQIQTDVLRCYWARWVLIKVAFAINEGFPSERIEAELAFGEDRLA